MSRWTVLFCGRKRTGKETAYKLLSTNSNGIRELQFSTPLKKFCIEVLGLTHSQCYGNDADRESKTQYRWGHGSFFSQDIAIKHRKKIGEPMTAREVLQVVGTDLMRDGFYTNLWAEAGARQVILADCELPAYFAFTDTRFPNEVLATRKVSNTCAVRLYRQTGLVDSHESETALDSWDGFPNLRELPPKDYLINKYISITPTLWKAITPSPDQFDFLLENNSNTDALYADITCLKNLLLGNYHLSWQIQKGPALEVDL